MDEPTAVPQPAGEPARHIRTYASDVAALTGKPLPKNVANEPAPSPTPKEPPPAHVIPKAPTTNETKETVLERLRRKAATPKEPQPPVSVAPLKAPSTKESKEEVLARLKRASNAEVPPGIPRVSKSAAPERIHTYTSDFKTREAASGASRIQMVAQQADAAPAPQVLTNKSRPPSFVIIAGTVLVLAGVGLVYAAYRFATGEPPIPQETFIASPIFVDERVKVGGSTEELRALLAQPSVSLSDGGVALLYLSYATTTKDGVTEIIATGGELIEALRLPAPNLLLRNIEPQSIVGFIKAENETRPFFIFKVDSYERTFAAMLDWEATLERDLSFIYPPHPVETPAELSTSTVFRLSFVDEVVGNRDARVLRDRDGRIVLLYGYRDKTTLVIARGEAAFLELLSRLSSTRGN